MSAGEGITRRTGPCALHRLKRRVLYKGAFHAKDQLGGLVGEAAEERDETEPQADPFVQTPVKQQDGQQQECILAQFGDQQKESVQRRRTDALQPQQKIHLYASSSFGSTPERSKSGTYCSSAESSSCMKPLSIGLSIKYCENSSYSSCVSLRLISG